MILIICFDTLLLLYILLSLFQSTIHVTGSVYTVTPDDCYYTNTTCHHCYNLQYYLLNASKYFATKTQLLFLPGIHHLHTDLIIQNVHNTSLIGNSTVINTTPDVVILCSASIVVTAVKFINVSNLTINNITINNCICYAHLYDGNYGFCSIAY